MYQKIEIATASQQSIPLIHHLKQKNLLNGVIVPKTVDGAADFFSNTVPDQYLKFIDHPKNLNPNNNTDLIISFGYPNKINLLPNVRMINIHFGKLPENRGADPLFRTLKSADAHAYITIHELTDQLDAGNIIKEIPVDIMPGEYYGLLSARLSNLCINLVDQIIAGQNDNISQGETNVGYFGKVTEQDTVISWAEMNAIEIERLVNASNPKYQGAKTKIMQNPLHIFEVSVAQINLPNGQNPLPGTIVHSTAQEGIFVVCKDKTFVRLDIISTNDGLVSGNKLASLGTRPGVILE